jgi:hypothetical protein
MLYAAGHWDAVLGNRVLLCTGLSQTARSLVLCIEYARAVILGSAAGFLFLSMLLACTSVSIACQM